jgi:hypothetical protein
MKYDEMNKTQIFFSIMNLFPFRALPRREEKGACGSVSFIENLLI